ncbi:hypothetical protein CH380_13055 [Leptospira adleri]|uniref:Uncharacterized protein n=1 Tax=Leptospira adleri TaxID=2023186 RepID=A0A2M9YMC8_9LEPT|nr:hypothetical protein CH380_13055 [Leptospira adleri]PJZ60496.1 hypothetical protein CH376_18230 [Leptospira adleri]
MWELLRSFFAESYLVKNEYSSLFSFFGKRWKSLKKKESQRFAVPPKSNPMIATILKNIRILLYSDPVLLRNERLYFVKRDFPSRFIFILKLTKGILF